MKNQNDEGRDIFKDVEEFLNIAPNSRDLFDLFMAMIKCAKGKEFIITQRIEHNIKGEPDYIGVVTLSVEQKRNKKKRRPKNESVPIVLP